jgi:hypothetical protein
MLMPYLERRARVEQQYRYTLSRAWGHGNNRALIVMLNPSTADAEVDDATIRSCVRLCQWRRDDEFHVVNLFAYRATDPKELKIASDPVGPDNDTAIETAASCCSFAICAWGAYPGAIDRGRQVYDLLHKRWSDVFCWGTTKHGAPKHPLYIKSGTPLEVYNM